MMYKIGGLFEGFEVNAHEFTPKEFYVLKFWEILLSCKENHKSFCKLWENLLLIYLCLIPLMSMNEKYERKCLIIKEKKDAKIFFKK